MGQSAGADQISNERKRHERQIWDGSVNIKRTVATFCASVLILSVISIETNAQDNIIIERKEVTKDKVETLSGKIKQDPLKSAGTRQRFTGERRASIFLERGGKPVKGEPGCSHRHVKCKEICFNVPSVPTRYRAVLDGRWTAVHNDPPSSYFNTNFGGAWARLEETLWRHTGNGRYKVCFLGKNWKHDWDRTINIEVSN